MPLPKEPIGPSTPGVSWRAALAGEALLDADDDESPAIAAEGDNEVLVVVTEGPRGLPGPPGPPGPVGVGVSDHLLLTNIGTNTHPQIDTHIAAANPHSGSQAFSAELQTIAAIVPANDDIIQRKAGAWVKRTMAQVKADLALVLADITAALGYTPVNKAGDAMTGPLTGVTNLGTTGSNTLAALAGTGVRRVMASATGDLSAEPPAPNYVPFVVYAGAAPIWTNMPLALTAFNGDVQYYVRLDTTNYRQVKFRGSQNVLGAAGSTLVLRSSPDFVTFTTIVSIPIDATGGSHPVSAWTNLPAASIGSDIWFHLFGQGGDGAADPQFRFIGMELR